MHLAARALSTLVRNLESTCLDGPALAGALRDTEGLGALAEHGSLGAERQGRVALHRGNGLEVRLETLAPTQSTALHGHGDACGAVRVLRGSALEIRVGHADRRLEPGDVAHVGSAEVHQLSNVGSEPLVTLHAYSPPLPVEQPCSEDGHQVLILGGGWCGVAVAMHALERGGADLRITLVEPGPQLGRGVAFGTTDPHHLLNVPAQGMSVDPARPDEFWRFARARGLPASPRSFLPRSLYGDYVEDRLARVVDRAAGQLRVVRADVASLTRGAGPWRVELRDGRELRAHDVVLATGHGAPRVPEALSPLEASPALIRDVWARGALEALGRDERVLIVGTGLTTLDVLGTLSRRGHTGRVTAVSWTGKWPLPHLDAVVWDGPRIPVLPDQLPATADGLAAWFEDAFDEARLRGLPWQAVMESFRPHIARVWERLCGAERERFLGTWRPVWERLRHRSPTAQLRAVRAWEEQGWLRTLRGSIASVDTCSGGAVEVRVRNGEDTTRVEVDRILLCTGPESDIRRMGSPWPELLGSGLVEACPHGLGVVTDDRGAIQSRGAAVPGLWAVGGLLRPRFFESTAVPDLAKQAASLGALLASA